MLGATPLGVEMAGNLGHRGLQVDFVDEGPWALSEVLDPDVAEPVHESLTKRGVTLRFGTRVEAFIGRRTACARCRPATASSSATR